MHQYPIPPQHLNERVILVTGAGQGIGRAAAISFAAQGATVILTGRKVKKLEAVYDDIEAAGHPLPLIFPINLEKAGEQEFKSMAEGIFQQLGRLDGILHNAARFDNLSPLEIQTEEQMSGMLRVNTIAPFLLTQACLPLLKRADDASVIFTSSTAAHTPAAYWGAHAVSKAATETMAKIWALELETWPNIRINTVIPGALQSPQRKKSHPGELHNKLPPIADILPLYHYLMGNASAGISGRIFDAQLEETAESASRN